MTVIHLGKDGHCYRNTGTYGSPTWNDCPGVQDLTLSDDHTEADVTRRASGGYRESMPTITDIEVSFSMPDDEDDLDLAAFLAAAITKVPIEVWILDGVNTSIKSYGPRFTAYVFSQGREESLEGAVIYNFKLKPGPAANPPAWVTGTP